MLISKKDLQGHTMSTTRYNILPIDHFAKLKVGILGGSFNPAHEGHLYITLEAIKRFGLDRVVWFVTPQNPLKRSGMSNSLEQRYESAKKIARDPRIIISDYERFLPNTYTYTLVERLSSMYKNVSFHYIIGADNMMQFHKWKEWKRIIKRVPLIVFDREQNHRIIRSSRLFQIIGNFKVTSQEQKVLRGYEWRYVKIRRNPLSSTLIRAQRLGSAAS